MHETLLVHFQKGFEQLAHDELGLVFTEMAVVLLEVLFQGASIAELHEEVQVIVRLGEVQQFDNVVIVELFQNSDLPLDLLQFLLTLLPTLDRQDFLLVDDLDSHDLGVVIDETSFLAGGERSLAQHFVQHVVVADLFFPSLLDLHDYI